MQKAVEIVSGGLTLRGMLHYPDGISERIPGVVVYHGFTGNKLENHFIFAKLSRRLEKEGIASVRFDFGCSGESDGDFGDMTPDTELRDAKAILDYLRGFDFIDNERVGICGLSMGGYIGGITAGDNRDLVKALCLWAPAGNMKYIFKDRLESFKKIGKGLVDIGGHRLSEKAYESAMKIDHIARTKAFDKGTCIIHGTGDASVPIKFGLEYKENMKNAAFHSIEGADHTFNRLDWSEEVLDITTSFFKEKL